MSTATVEVARTNRDKAFPYSLSVDGVEIARAECAELANILANAPGLAAAALKSFEASDGQ